MTDPHSRIRALDGVRGLAILLVLVFHSMRFMHESPADDVLFTLRSICWSGVDLFFVLSGFLITGILLHTRDKPHYFRNFYMRRTLRIFPLYYGYLFAVFAVLPLVAWLAGWELPRAYHTAQERQLWLWTYMQNYLQALGGQERHTLPGFGPFWSLAIEEQFYLVWPLVVALTKPRALLPLTVALCVAVPVLRGVLWAAGVDARALYHLTPTRIDSLLLGALAVQILRTNVAVPAAALRGIAGACAVAIAAPMVVWGDFSTHRAYVTIAGYSLVAVLFACGLLLVVQGHARPTTVRVLESRLLTTCGKYSYAMYVFHWPIAFYVRLELPNTEFGKWIHASVVGRPLVQFAITFTSVLLLAMLSWRLWESHWLKLKDRFA
jgi:peptidoglycan/LPS O-acetylase OafA/YrhL